MTAAVSIALGFAFGLGSALFPLLNAEAYAVASVARSPWLLIPIALTLAIGQTVGKLILFEAARRGSSLRKSRKGHSERGARRWMAWIQQALRDRRTALPLVFFSAGVGLPPLALVSIAAGSAGQSRPGFALMCFAGRTTRFAVLATPIALAVTRS